MHVLRGKPSPAMVVAICALAFAMVGTAVAGTDGLSSKVTKSKVKKIAKKQADKELKANVSGSHVNQADNATNASNASNADVVDGKSASDLIRTSFASNNTSVTLPIAGSATVLTATIDAPSAGFVTAIANVTITGPGSALAHCGVALNGVDTWIGDDAFAQSIRMDDVNGGPESCSPNARFTVGAGTQTVRYRGHNDGVGALAARGGSLTLIYEPFGSTGQQGTRAPDAQAAPGPDSNG